MPAAELGSALQPFLLAAGYGLDNGPDPAGVADAYRERAHTMKEMAESCRYCYEDFAEIDPNAAKKHLRPVIQDALQDARDRFAALSDWTSDAVANAIEECAAAKEIKMGKIGQPIRVAVTGGSVSPPIDITLALIGQERTLTRLDSALEFISARAAAG
jgi:glutamyl-tRNA synthetase